MNLIDLNLEDIYKGKATLIKDNKYFSTQQYIEPFVDRTDKLCQGNYLIKAVPANQISITPDGAIDTEDLVFNRINIEAIIPGEYEFEGHQKAIGMVYGLDTRKPVVKFYTGALRSACTNLCVFSPNALNVQELQPETAINYKFVEEAVNMKLVIGEILKQISHQHYTKEQCFNNLGEWIDNCINFKFHTEFGAIKLSETAPISAYKSLFYNEKSDYFAQDGEVTGFDIYNALTDNICNGRSNDICNRFEKVFLAGRIMNLC